MITTCTGCHARYRLDADKVPHRKIRVRCPDCSHVFELDGSVREPAPVASPALDAGLEPAAARVERPVADTSPSGSMDLDLEPAAPLAAGPEPEPEQELEIESGPPTSATPAPEPARRAASLDGSKPGSRPESGGVAVADAPRQNRRRRRDKSEMLARALVSDILVYNREARDKALAAGNLLEALGPEIKKSWELYKEKVGAEAATGTSHFKDALNEILAEGQDIF